ncbi:MAG: LemA family protein [Planctomycetes bacterium]|nr:LemA family protein [Planctomycetota bacterium]
MVSGASRPRRFIRVGTVIAVVVGVVVVIGLIVMGLYNGLVSRRNEAKNAWSQIDVQLKRRYDLIPNLVETVKGYMKHESNTLEAVIRARQQCVDLSRAGNIGELAKAEGLLSTSLRGLMAVSEGYPDLKANQNMLKLQEELASTENKISFARQAYNDAAMRLNNAIEQFPNNVLFSSFKQVEYFEVESAEERKAVKVSF